ncbi:MAG TPA: hemerythrin domain-containing protein [Burkholderiaceae bacterium]|nr:hemerythrin domain-containing protein [Burkholderiaceae bacterium]
MPTPHTDTPSSKRGASRAISKARNELLAQLKDDHQRVKKAYSKYRRLDGKEDDETRQSLVQQVLAELSIHAQLEEELLYPAAMEHLEDRSQIEEAQVEHEMLHVLIDQLRGLDPGDETHAAELAARFTVLCEYTLHHVKEEEREMFPQLMKLRLDWPALARDFEERRAELNGEFAEDDMAPDGEAEEAMEAGGDEESEEDSAAQEETMGSDDSETGESKPSRSGSRQEAAATG